MKLIRHLPSIVASLAGIRSLVGMPVEDPVRVLTALGLAGVALLLWPLPDPGRSAP